VAVYTPGATERVTMPESRHCPQCYSRRVVIVSQDDVSKACRCEHCGCEWTATERSIQRLLSDVVKPPRGKDPSS